MAQAARTIDPNLKPLSDSLNSSLASETARVSDKLANSLGGSRLAGDGFKKINDKIKDIGEQMTQVLADELTDQELLKDAGMLALVKAASELNNEDIKKNLTDTIEDGAQNIDPNEAIDNFGNSPLPEDKSVAEQIAEHEAKQAANDNVETPPPVAANDNVENQPHDRMQAGMDRTKEKSEADKKAALNPDALDKAQAANDNVENDTKPEPEVPPINTTESTPKSQPKPEQKPEESQPQPKPAATPEEPTAEPEPDKNPEPNLAPKPEPKPEEKPEESQPQPKPAATPEEPTAEPEPEANPIDQALNDAGLPLVDTDEDNPMLPKKTEIEKAAEQAKQQESAQNNENNQPDGNAPQSPEGENPENPNTPPQPGQERGKITQGVNYLRNRDEINQIDKETQANYKKLQELLNEIKKLNDVIGPIERKINILRAAYWSLMVVAILLYLLAAILAATIIFLFMFPIAPPVWYAAQLVSDAANAIDLKMDTLKNEIKDKQEERDKKETEAKKYKTEIKNLSIRRYNLKNQSLLSRGDPNAPANT